MAFLSTFGEQTHRIASFSHRGHAPCLDNDIKDICRPGVVCTIYPFAHATAVVSFRAPLFRHCVDDDIDDGDEDLGSDEDDDNPLEILTLRVRHLLLEH